MDKGYDNASFFYDRLSRLVFGARLQQAQLHFLPLIAANSKVLIVGGGSGWILEEIARVQPAALTITYVDASPKMVALAAKRTVGAAHKVAYIARPIQQASIGIEYDIIITPFFFDNFTESDVTDIFGRLHTVLKKGGIWLYTDFRDNGVATHKLLLKGMYLFFSVLCGVRAKKLPDMDDIFTAHGYMLQGARNFVNGFVESSVYIKNAT